MLVVVLDSVEGPQMNDDEKIVHVPHDKFASMVCQAVGGINRRITILYVIVGGLGGLYLALAFKVFGR